MSILYQSVYDSPLGRILIGADQDTLKGIWFDGQKYAPDLSGAVRNDDLPVVLETCRWLDLYFSGKDPGFFPALSPEGTDFRKTVWAELMEIPYGETTTYGAIARAVAGKCGLNSMSAQAVGGAVGHNPISILIPCHRVVGANGSLTGYAGGLDRKRALLALERGGMTASSFTGGRMTD